jgi:hypothetical protein
MIIGGHARTLTEPFVGGEREQQLNQGLPGKQRPDVK